MPASQSDHAAPSPDGGEAMRWHVTGLTHFDFLCAEYRDLHTCSNASVFQGPIWLDRLYAILVPKFGAAPLVITICDRSSGRLVALYPLVTRRYWGLCMADVADLGVSDYCALVVAPADLPALRADRLLPGQIRQALKGCDIVAVRKIQEQALDAFAMLGKARQARMTLNAYAVELFEPFTAWRKQKVARSQARSLDSKRRRLRKKGPLTVEVAEDPEKIAEALGHIRAFRDQRNGVKGFTDILRDDTFLRFYREAAQDNPSVRVYVMTQHGRPVSVLYGLVRNGTFHMLLSGFDIIGYRNYSVGLLIIEDVIADCIARGETSFDMTIGHQAYKREFGPVDSSMWSIWCGISPLGKIIAFSLSRSPLLLVLVRRLIRIKLWSGLPAPWRGIRTLRDAPRQKPQ